MFFLVCHKGENTAGRGRGVGGGGEVGGRGKETDDQTINQTNLAGPHDCLCLLQKRKPQAFIYIITTRQ